MNHKLTDHTSDWTQNWNGSIAVKLTAIILWSVMIAGFFLTVPFMLTFEDHKLKDNLWSNQLLINLIETNITNQKIDTYSEIQLQKLETQLQKFIDDSEVEYVSIEIDDLNISRGLASEDNYQSPTIRFCK